MRGKPANSAIWFLLVLLLFAGVRAAAPSAYTPAAVIAEESGPVLEEPPAGEEPGEDYNPPPDGPAPEESENASPDSVGEDSSGPPPDEPSSPPVSEVPAPSASSSELPGENPVPSESSPEPPGEIPTPSESASEPPGEESGDAADADGDNTGPEEFPPPAGPIPAADSPTQLGNWTSYNGVIFEDAAVYQSQSGGGLAVGGALAVRNSFTVGSTYSSEYDPTRHIGEYTNEGAYPALLLGGDALEVGSAVTELSAYGGAVTMTPELLELHQEQPVRFVPQTDSFYQTADRQLLDNWFTYQYHMARSASEMMLLANDSSIGVTELSSGSYAQAGPDAYRNQTFEVNGEVYQNALFITVHTGSDLNLGQWWPVHSILYLDVNWAIESDLVVFNFPEAVNVTMSSSAFHIAGMEHWSTTVDAWVGERGMLERRALAEKVVYNFPAARSIEADQALIQGTILAPDAAFTGVGYGDAGHIYGHIIARRYTAQGNFTIHAFSLTPWVYDIVEDALSKHTDTGAISLGHYLYFGGEPTTIRAQGAEFVLENHYGQYLGASGFVTDISDAAVYATSLEGYTRIGNVPLGDYTLVKTTAPEGFDLNNADPGNPYTYFRHPVSVEEAGQTVRAVRYSEPATLDLVFRKVDASTGEGLAGAVFAIVREGDEYQDATVGESYTSGDDGVFVSRSVPVGEYHLVEVEPPPGYAMVAGGEFRFSVVWEESAGALIIRDAEGAPLSATAERPAQIPNRPGAAGNTAMLIKYTEHAGEPGTHYTLPGAQFALYRRSGEADWWEPVEQNDAGEALDITTNAFGYCRIDHLPPATYRVVETKAPPGFSVTNPHADEAHAATFPTGYAYQFTFADTAAFYTAYLPSNALEVEMTVTVSALLLGEVQALAGAEFRLEQLLDDGKTWGELLDSARTDSGGELLLEALPADTYRLTQLQATRGFRIPEPAVVYFTVAFDEWGNPVVSATHNGLEVGGDTAPVRLETVGGIRLHIDNQPNLCDFLVYKIDGDYTVGTGENGVSSYGVEFLENAEFRLRRRATARSAWEDYGGAFVSALQYTGDGQPLLDSYGNHVAAAAFPGGLIYGEYQLVETRPPEGYHTNSSIEVTFSDGATGRQLHLFTITEAMAGAGLPSAYTAADYADRHSTAFRFRLVDGGGGAIGGAEFSLYHCAEEHTHSTQLGAGSCWAASTPVNAASGADGVVAFVELATGEYLLRQDKTAAGYHLPGALWLVSVDAESGAVDVQLAHGPARHGFVASGEDEVAWLLRNWQGFALPSTGGRGTLWFAITGLFLIAAALLVKYKLQARKQDRPFS